MKKYKYSKDAFFTELKGNILNDITVEDNAIFFEDYNGDTFVLKHHQECCEDVYIEDICGDLEDIKHDIIISAEEVTNQKDGGGDGSETWTFYKIDTKKGGVTIRFYGTSNGYYSETASLSHYADVIRDSDYWVNEERDDYWEDEGIEKDDY